MSNREQLSVILEMLGLGRLDASLLEAGTISGKRLQRLRIWFLAAMLPAGVWLLLLLYAVGAIALAASRAQANDRSRQPASPLRLRSDSAVPTAPTLPLRGPPR
jgi:hypothetical protein